MALATLPGEEAILARLRENLTQDVYDDDVPDDRNLRKGPDGLFLPYIVVYFGGPYRAAAGKGIIGTRYDMTAAGCTVRVIAARKSDTRAIKDLVTDLLCGFIPPDAGELRLEGGGGSQIVTSTTTTPAKYAYDLAFSYYANLIN